MLGFPFSVGNCYESSIGKYSEVFLILLRCFWKNVNVVLVHRRSVSERLLVQCWREDVSQEHGQQRKDGDQNCCFFGIAEVAPRERTPDTGAAALHNTSVTTRYAKQSKIKINSHHEKTSCYGKCKMKIIIIIIVITIIIYHTPSIKER